MASKVNGHSVAAVDHNRGADFGPSEASFGAKVARILAFFVRRFPYLLVVLFGISIVVFLLGAIIPGDVASAILGPRATPEGLAAIRNQYGLNEPLLVQYSLFLWRLLHADLGISPSLNEPVAYAIATHLPPTLFLVFYAAIMATLAAIPLALLAAVQRGGMADRAVRIFVVAVLSMPTYWVGIMLVLFVALPTGLFPVTGYGNGFLERLWHLFLPALTLVFMFLALIVRALRASLIEVLQADYVALARNKGISSLRLYLRHVLRNGLLPAITVLGLNMSFLIGGTVIVESIFGIPGMGNLMVNAMLARDFLLVQGITLAISLVVIGINFAVDMLYMKIDPRVRMA